MKIKGQPGEFAFKALKPTVEVGGEHGVWGYELSNQYYLIKPNISGWIWPVEVYEDGSIYIPDVSEYEDSDEIPKVER